MKTFWKVIFILQKFYWISFSFCIFAWFGNRTLNNKNGLWLLVKPASKISGCWQDGLLGTFNNHELLKAHSVITFSHPVHSEFDSLPSGCCFRVAVEPKDSRLRLFLLQTIALMTNIHFGAFYYYFYSTFIFFFSFVVTLFYSYALDMCLHVFCPGCVYVERPYYKYVCCTHKFL